MPDHPLLACYGGPRSTGAVQLTTALAESLHEPLVVTSVYETERIEAGGGAAERNARREAGARDRAERALRLVTSPILTAEAVVPATGTPAAVADLARDIDACLIVLGRDEDGRVTRSVIAQAPCPVAVSPLTTAVPGADALHRIGVAYDGSPCARLAVTAAMHLSLVTGAAVRILTVGPVSAGVSRAEAADLPPQSPIGVTAEVCRLTGDPRTCLEEATAGLDLLVCGSRGRGRVTGRLLGSVSARLVDAGRCPVLVIPAATEHRAGTPLGLTTGADG